MVFRDNPKVLNGRYRVYLQYFIKQAILLLYFKCLQLRVIKIIFYKLITLLRWSFETAFLPIKNYQDIFLRLVDAMKVAFASRCVGRDNDDAKLQLEQRCLPPLAPGRPASNRTRQNLSNRA